MKKCWMGIKNLRVFEKTKVGFHISDIDGSKYQSWYHKMWYCKCSKANTQMIPKPIFDAHPTFFKKTLNQGITIDPKKQPEEDCILNEC